MKTGIGFWRMCGGRALPLGIALGLALLGGVARAGSGTDLVWTQDGAVQGKTVGTMTEFLGIPYAAPPVGELRWRAPHRVQPWQGVRDATQFGPHCAQNASPFGLASTSEDCLYLNVFVPGPAQWALLRTGEVFPVMFWIHGGALVVGESDDYDPAALVARGVIVVSINYRLGALGFLVHPALAENEEGKIVVNYGLRDQQAALQWVHRNIGAFGGDADNVTVFGESAGGLSTLSQVVSPRSRGLLNKAIVESGAYSLALPTVAQSEVAGTAFAAAIGCTDQSAECLRHASLAAILANEAAGGYVPSVDGVVLPSSLGTALATGAFNRVPVVQGSNHDEWRLFVALDFDLVSGPLNATTYAAVLDGTYGPILGPVVLAAYPVASYPSADLADAAQGTDFLFACSGRLANQRLAQYVPVFAYEFSDENAPQDFLPPVSFPYGAAHASELQYLFGLTTSLPHAGLTATQQSLSAQMVGYWTRFAKNSDPNERGLPYWARYSSQDDAYQRLVPGGVMPEFGFAAEHNCAFWAPIQAAIGE